MKKFVILGGGYGGITIAHHIVEQLPDDVMVVLVDQMPFQGLKTEYYALVAGTAADIHLRVNFPTHPQMIHRFGTVTNVDLSNKIIHFSDQEPLEYDWLSIGLGCTDKYHNIPGAEQYTNSVQSFSQARLTYQRINNVKPHGMITIVGGGLSGVEIASELRESRPDLNIRILDRGSSILSSFPEKLQSFVRGWMTEHDIEMRPYVSLVRVDGHELYNEDEILYTDETIWTAGIQPSPIVQALCVPKDAQGRVIINEYHQIPDHPEVFVVGDCAALPFSPSGQAAEAQGKQIAEVMHAFWRNETPRLGKIKLKGILGSLGKKTGFGVMGKKTVMTGTVPRVIKNGVLWMSKHHFG